MPDDTPLPYLTNDLQGVGGAIKYLTDDFRVEEVPLYEPCGSGTHTYFGIEKRGLTTLAAIQIIAKALGKRPRDIGYAGLKDAHAVARQTMSIEHVSPDRVRELRLGRIEILWVNRHGNKIKLGHLRGNRFTIKIRPFESNDFSKDQACRASTIVERLAVRGVPNFFGPQRFGSRGDNARVGEAVLRDNFNEAVEWMVGRPGPLDHGKVLEARRHFEGKRYWEAAESWPKAFGQQQKICRLLAQNPEDTRKAWMAVEPTLRTLYVSAFQSEIFNRVVARRVDALDRIQVGDLAWKHINGACFLVEDADAEQPRCTLREISPTGPLFGPRMTPPRGTPAEVEAEVLAGAGLPPEEFRDKNGAKVAGGRRPLRVPAESTELEQGVDDEGPYLRLVFGLPAGSYATCVTREITKDM